MRIGVGGGNESFRVSFAVLENWRRYMSSGSESNPGSNSSEEPTSPAAQSEQEACLQAILNTAVEAIITIDEQGICKSANAAAESMFGYTTNEFLGSNVSILMPSPYRQEHDDYLANYLRSGVKKIIGIGREAMGQRKNGETFPIQIAISEVQLADHRLFTGFIQDITEQKESQRRLVQSERLAVLGEAMARLAHEGRNSLQRIQIAVETARLHCETETPLSSQLDVIERAGDGLNSLLDELKNFASPLNLEKEQVSLASIWREAWRSTSLSRVGRVVELKESLPEQDDQKKTYCKIDRFRMGQVFYNLFDNALAACEDPVEIEIHVSACQNTSGPTWKIRVRDNGPGLNDQHRARIFEPFFTTKTKGTGLGMAIVRRIVEAHHGTITLGTAEGGAEFVIELPQ